MGIYPQLASLEMILYPKLTGILLNAAFSAPGVTRIPPWRKPVTLFIHGQKRVLPVKLTELRITEQAHDTSLNPIQSQDFIGPPGFILFRLQDESSRLLCFYGASCLEKKQHVDRRDSQRVGFDRFGSISGSVSVSL